MQMICRNRVADFDRWWDVFKSQADAHRAAGLHLETLWRNADEPNEIFFVFQVDDRARAAAFISAPDAAAAGERAGVVDGDYTFVERFERTAT